MAEQVNQRIEDMINELEQMRRTNLFDDEEIREISRKRKEFEYRIQRRVKQKEDFVQYIAYELTLLKEIAIRRKQAKLTEKKKDIEFAVAKRINKVFKQFIYRYQNEIEIYFEYIRFCKSVGFEYAISAIIGQMLQIHGEKPKMWQLASKWEKNEQDNLQNAREFLLKGLHRHPEADVLYLDLFEIELAFCFNAETEEEKDKQIKRADVVWKNGIKNVCDIKFLFKLFEISIKCDAHTSIIDSIKQEIWSRNDCMEVWSYIAAKELQGCHWEEIEEFVDDESNYSQELRNFVGVYKAALQRFPDIRLCTQYIHDLLGVNESVCTELQKLSAVKKAWYYGYAHGILSNDMFQFGIEVLKAECEICSEKLLELFDNAPPNVKQNTFVWEETLKLCKSDEMKMLVILQEAIKILKPDDAIYLSNFLLDNVESKDTFKNLYKRFLNCENTVLMAVKPKLLKKIFEHNGLKAARSLYEELVKTPPTQAQVHLVMIEIENSQEKPNIKLIRKYYECLVQHHGDTSIDVWLKYMNFESYKGNAQSAPNIYRRAIGALRKDLVDEFIKSQTLSKLN